MVAGAPGSKRSKRPRPLLKAVAGGAYVRKIYRFRQDALTGRIAKLRARTWFLPLWSPPDGHERADEDAYGDGDPPSGSLDGQGLC